MKVIRYFVGMVGAFFLFTALLSGCGGGSGGGDGTSATGTISGSAVKGPVSGATVTAYRINGNGTAGSQIGTAITDAQGIFSMNVENYSGAVMLRLTGGNYIDEATGQRINMYQNTVMTAVIPDMMPGDTIRNIQITPVTSLAQARAQNMTGGMTRANIVLANHAMGQFFDIDDILTCRPMDPLVQGSGTGANHYERNYGMTLAAISQEAADLTMPYSSGMITLMMDDASDGKMDGMMGSNHVYMGGMGGMMGGIMMERSAGTTDLARAMSEFIANTMVNRSGVTTTDMQALINRLNDSDGAIH